MAKLITLKEALDAISEIDNNVYNALNHIYVGDPKLTTRETAWGIIFTPIGSWSTKDLRKSGLLFIDLREPKDE